MKRKWIIVVAPLAIAAFIVIGGEVVMHLWNWLMPAIFGLKMITFWQAIGLLILARILVGGLGGGSHNGRRRERRLRERWEHMTPEERERLREWMRGRGAGPGGAPTGTHEPA